MKLYKLIPANEALKRDDAFFTDKALVEVQPSDRGEDTKRLDWLLENHNPTMSFIPTGESKVTREAIDAAMKGKS